MRRRALEAANRQGAETSTDGSARAPMPWFLQELRQHCRRRLVERSSAGNHNTAILLPRRGKVLASKTPRCHRPPFSLSFGTVQGAWSARFPSTASVIRTRCSCHRDYARISTEARYWAPFVKRSEPMRSDGCQLTLLGSMRAPGCTLRSHGRARSAAWQQRAPALCRCLGHQSSRSRERMEPRPTAARFVLPTRPVLGHAGSNLPPLLLLIFVERAQRQ